MAVKIVWDLCQTKYGCQNCVTLLSGRIWASNLSDYLSKFSNTCQKYIWLSKLSDTFVRQNIAVKIVWHFCQVEYGRQTCLILLSKFSNTCQTYIWLPKLSDTFVRQNMTIKLSYPFVRQNVAVNIVWNFCQTINGCQFLTLLSDKISLYKLSDIFDKIVWHMFWHFWHSCQTKYRCQNCLTFMSKLADTSFDTFDTFVRQNIAVKLSDIFVKNCLTHDLTLMTLLSHEYDCQHCLTHVLTLLTLLLDRISLSILSAFLSKLSNTCFDTYDTFVREHIAVKVVCHFCQNSVTKVLTFLTLLSHKIWPSKLSDTSVRQNMAVKFPWYFYQNCLTQVLTLLTLLSDKILLSKLYDIFVKIVWYMYFTSDTFVWHISVCQICLIFLSNCLTHDLTLLTLLSDKIWLSNLSVFFVKIVWQKLWHFWLFC